MMQSC